MKRLNDSDVPEARLAILLKTESKVKEKEKTTSYSPAEEWVLAAASTEEPEEREFVVDSGASWSVRKTLTLLRWTMRTSRSPTTVMTAERRGAHQRRSDSKCQAIGLTRQSCVSWGNSRIRFLEETLWGSWENVQLDQRSETPRDWLQFSNDVPLVVPGLSASSSSTTQWSREQKWKRCRVSIV